MKNITRAEVTLFQFCMLLLTVDALATAKVATLPVSTGSVGHSVYQEV